MKITLVEPQKKNLRRFNIYLDGKFGFGVDEDTVVKFRLLPEKEITAEDLDQILIETEVGKLMGRMYNLFSVRQRSEKEIRDYIRNLNFKKKVKDQEEIPELIIELLIENLKKKEMLNDGQFAKSWTESRSRKKGWKVIQMELYQKGISREIINEQLSINNENQNENKVAKEVLEKKARIWKNLPKLEFKQKATQFLLRQGFEYSTAKEVINNFFSNDSEKIP